MMLKAEVKYILDRVMDWYAEWQKETQHELDWPDGSFYVNFTDWCLKYKFKNLK